MTKKYCHVRRASTSYSVKGNSNHQYSCEGYVFWLPRNIQIEEQTTTIFVKLANIKDFVREIRPTDSPLINRITDWKKALSLMSLVFVELEVLFSRSLTRKLRWLISLHWDKRFRAEPGGIILSDTSAFFIFAWVAPIAEIVFIEITEDCQLKILQELLKCNSYEKYHSGLGHGLGSWKRITRSVYVLHWGIQIQVHGYQLLCESSLRSQRCKEHQKLKNTFEKFLSRSRSDSALFLWTLPALQRFNNLETS